MPRVNLSVPQRQRDLEADLRAWSGSQYVSIKDITAFLGAKDRRVAAGRVRGLPYQPVGRSKRYNVRDVARRLYEAETA